MRTSPRSFWRLDRAPCLTRKFVVAWYHGITELLSSPFPREGGQHVQDACESFISKMRWGVLSSEPMPRLLPTDYVHRHIHQAAVVEIRLPDLDKEDLHLVPRPAAAPGQRAQSNSLRAVQ